MATASKPADKPAQHSAPPPEPHKPAARGPATPTPLFAPINDAASLFKNGHRIAKEGDPPEKWITMGRLGDGTPVHQMPMTPEIEQEIKSGQYYMVDGLDESATAPPVGPPVVVDRPYVGGAATVGSTLTCTQGNWTNTPTNKGYQWLHDGASIAAATGATYTIIAADVGGKISCEVTAVNAAGSASATSNEVGPVT